MKKNFLFIWFLLILGCLTSCDSDEKNSRLFKKLSSDHTGIKFSNEIIANDSINILDFYYCYNGGGVGIGDVNNDGLQDVFFGGNVASSRLYLNEGDMEFTDITETANITTEDWIMGVSLVDINSDGLLDIYLSVAGPEKITDFKNLLYINQGINSDGIPSFLEQAEEYGLADNSFSIQAAFLDYDGDGDLDMFLLTNGVDASDKMVIHPKGFPITQGLTKDRLYKNIGTSDSLGHPYYTEVSEETGIKLEGYGLGVAVDDLNDDGWPDIYVANDFLPNDMMYINQRDGTFLESSFQSQRHQSHNGMGVDIADINNDLSPEILVMDMLPKSNSRRKSMMGGTNYDAFLRKREYSYVPQFMQNTLQLNLGKDTEGVTHFSDIAQLVGIHDTDWSWAPLMADFNNDGYKDIYITNGYVKDVTDLDFINYGGSSAMFGPKAKQDAMDLVKGVKVSNFLFKNSGNLEFEDASESWGIDIPSYSNGAAYADLDNDGDLDIVVNNINDEAFIFENLSNRLLENSNFLQLKIKGSKNNTSGIGAKVTIHMDNTSQYYYHSQVKGYLSSIHTPIHFGIGEKSFIDSLKITWSDGKSQIVKNIQANQILELDHQEAGLNDVARDEKKDIIFREANEEYGIFFKHTENNHNDFADDPLLHRLYSRGGPGIGVGDVNSNNRQDFFIGGSTGTAGSLFLQAKDGTFTKKKMEISEFASEDMGVLFFDSDNDGDLDLYVVSGGSEFKKGAEEYQDRLYINDGAGNFSRNIKALPEMISSGSCVVGADYDKDGDIDLFVGGMYSPGEYPTAPRSFLLENQNGTFIDATEEKANELASIGLVTSAVWTDFDNDGWIDLIVVGEWMPITFFQNQQGKLVNITEKTGLQHTNGWWNSIYPTDIDNDGDIDYIVGNMGLNIDYRPTPEYPLHLFAYDYNEDGKTDPLLFQYQKNKENEQELVPFHRRNDFLDQLRNFGKKFPNYGKYANAQLTDVISQDQIDKANKFTAERFESSIVENKGNGKFTIRPLPIEAQISSINGIYSEDFDNDGNMDLVIAGNSYASEIQYGWQDASLGLYLKGDGHGNFQPIMSQSSGLFLNKDIKGFSALHNTKGGKVLLAAANSDSLIALTPNMSPINEVIWARPLDSYAEILYRDGTKRKKEFYYGAGYLSQSSRSIEISDKIESISIVDSKGNRRIVQF